jgi:type VI secretion system protein ImpA
MNTHDPLGPVMHAALLAPISTDQPSGVSLRYDPLYREVESARRSDDVNLPQGIWEQTLKRAEWPLVERLCREALATRTKDLQLAAWLAEAWVWLRGMEGLSDGAHLMRGLVEHFWDDVHPQMEDGDIEFRQAPCEWFARNLHLALLSVPLAAGRSAAGLPWTLGEWELVLRKELHAAQAAKGMRGRDKGAPPPEQIVRSHFVAAAAATPANFYLGLQAEIEDAALALDRLGESLRARLGAAAPNFGAIAERLDLCYSALQELGCIQQWQDEGQAEADMADITDAAGVAAHEAQSQGPRGAIRSREDAYRALDEAADYLLRTEPHSPTPYLVKRAVGWGKMPLAELLQELLDNESDLKQIYRLLGTAGQAGGGA